MQRLIKVLKALSDETRLRILKILQEKDSLCVCEIMQALDISQTRASRNLGILKDAGFVTDRREGVWAHYSINRKKVNEYHHDIMRLLQRWLNDDETIKKDKERLKKVTRSNSKYRCVKPIIRRGERKWHG
ncbi:MAG: ArsR family transcriptional regulator [Thermotogae bacterium]|nr:MAG: ArsR family transcriptional regulator [Thermotogota bacterium]